MTTRDVNSRSIVRSSLGTTAAVAFGSLVSLAATPVLVQGLEPAQYGAWATLGGVAVLLSLSDVGLRTEVIRRVAVARGLKDDAGVSAAANQGVGALLRIGGVAVVIASAALLALWSSIFNDIDVDRLPLIASAIVVLAFMELVNSTFHAVLSGAQLTHWEQFGRVSGTVVAACAGAISVAAGAGLSALVVARAAGLVVTVVIHHAAVRRFLPSLRFRPAWPERAAGWLTLPLLALVSQVADIVDSQIDKLVIATVSGTAAVASYHVGTTLVVQLRAALLTAVAPLLPGLAQTRVRDEASAQQLYWRGALTLYSVGLPVLGTVAVLGGPLISVWIPTPLPEAAEICAVFGLGMTLNLLSVPITLRALAESRHRMVAASAALNIVANLSLSVALTVAVGPVGAAYGSVIGTIVGVAYIVWVFRRSVGKDAIPAAHRHVPVLAWFIGLAAAGVPQWTPTWPELIAGTVGVGAVGFSLSVWPNRSDVLSPSSIWAAIRGTRGTTELNGPSPQDQSPI